MGIYHVKRNNYLKISTLLIVTCSLFAGILNFEGGNCINKINSLTNEIKINKTGKQQQQQITPIQQLYKIKVKRKEKNPLHLYNIASLLQICMYIHYMG